MEPTLPQPANYMWRSQTDFFFHAKMGFEEIVAELKCGLVFNLFLVGFEIDGATGSCVVRVEPDACAFPLEELEEEYRAFDLKYAPPPDADSPTEEAYNAALRAHDNYCWELRTLLAEAMEAEIDPANTLSFCSQPCQVGNHLVSLVLLLSRADYDKHPQLAEAVSYMKRGHHPSFLHAVIEAYLQQYSVQILMPGRMGSFLLRDRNPRQLLRAAGARFAHNAAYAGRMVDPIEIMKKGPYDLFEACNVISSMRYEGAEGVGRMVVSEKGHSAITVQVEFCHPVEVGDYRKVRKLLEMCNEKTWLLSADRKIYGLGTVNYSAYNKSEENLFEIRFVKHHSWELVHAGRPLMITTYNEPRLPLPKFDEDDLRATLRQWISGVTDESVEKIVGKGRMASDAKHGTTLIISGDAVGETVRLGSQGFPVVPFEIDLTRMNSVMCIDGGILLDAQGVCHGVGILLDGKATPRGDSARGARYNSAIRYVEGRGDAVVLVVSEDGIVNIVAPSGQQSRTPQVEPAGQAQSHNEPPEADVQLAAFYLYRKRGPTSDRFRNWLAAERGLYFRARRRAGPAE